MMLRTRRRTWKIGATAATATLASILLSTMNAPAANADGTVVAGNQKCSDLVSGALEFKVESPATGRYASGAFAVDLKVYALASDVPDHPGDQTGNEVFDFAASGGSILGVAVKGGPDTNFYSTPNGVTSGSKLHAPLNTKNAKFPELSHVSFCYVPKAKPKIETKVSHPEITIGAAVTDTATLSAGNKPTGTITFKVYGPDDAECKGTATTVGSVSVNGNAAYTSPAFTPAAVGTYRFIASYSGDAKNDPVAGACNDPDEQVKVNKAKTAIKTQVAKPTITIGGSVTDTATLSGGFQPTGTITFTVYGPDDDYCKGTGTTVGSVTVNGAGTYTSPAFTPAAVGTYRFIASYSGDAKNDPVAGACNDPNEQVEVAKAKPNLGTKPNVLPNDTATVSGLVDPSGGKITFKLFTNLTCTGTPVYTHTQPVTANGTFVTANTSVRVDSDASISWLVDYTGDAKNEGAVSACTDEQVVMDFTPLGK